MNYSGQRFCAWVGGPLCMVLLTVGWVLFARFVPPQSPMAGADAIAEIYRQNTVPIRIGMMLITLAGPLNLLFAAAISSQLRRIEGNAPLFTYSQLAGGAALTILFILPGQLWSVVAFRPERDANLMLLYNDLAWFLIIMPFGVIGVQNLSIGLAVLFDRNPQPVFPRWVAFFNFWVALLQAPASLITFFKTGPFAWDGLFAFWLGLAAFGAWYMVMFVLLLRAINRQQREQEAN